MHRRKPHERGGLGHSLGSYHIGPDITLMHRLLVSQHDWEKGRSSRYYFETESLIFSFQIRMRVLQDLRIEKTPVHELSLC